MCCDSWGRQESVMTERLNRTEGNGNPLQYSCLENPMDGGTWWITVYGVAESDTTDQLHFLSTLLRYTLYNS